VPALIVVAAVRAAPLWRWNALPSMERRLRINRLLDPDFSFDLGAVCCAEAFLRYVIMATPVACLLSAWLLVRGCNLRPSYAGPGAAILALTSVLSAPLQLFADPPQAWYAINPESRHSLYRRELSTLLREVFDPPPDPNRLVIEWLQRNAASSDEILVNYEDVPLMFYLPNPIRGGIAAFAWKMTSESAGFLGAAPKRALCVLAGVRPGGESLQMAPRGF